MAEGKVEKVRRKLEESYTMMTILDDESRLATTEDERSNVTVSIAIERRKQAELAREIELISLEDTITKLLGSMTKEQHLLVLEAVRQAGGAIRVTTTGLMEASHLPKLKIEVDHADGSILLGLVGGSGRVLGRL